MVLLDTSVLLRFIARREPFFSEVSAMLRGREAAGHELVFGEILIGEVGGGRKQFLDDYRRIPWVIRVPHNEVVSFVRMRRLSGRGIGWIDSHLLASAIAARARLWTADARLLKIAEELGIAYKAG
jgi:predicted nucleic acid-binding protein